jgi:hypothetical protein
VTNEHDCADFAQGISDSLAEVSIDLVSHYIDDHGPELPQQARDLIKRKAAESLVSAWVVDMDQILDAARQTHFLIASVLSHSDDEETVKAVEDFLKSIQQ